ncbi:MAG: MBL fold metallo-hydrolase [Proteobacteria bacterium]|nr:MBL fold metallo-hydrolase [Pseudomonadota bacterium]
MTRILLVPVLVLAMVCAGPAVLAQTPRTDVIPTADGPIEITMLGHASLMFVFQGRVVYVDPWIRMDDLSGRPKANLILITHEHRDHLDTEAIGRVMKEGTVLVVTRACAEELGDRFKAPMVMGNGDTRTAAGFQIEAVPAYNLVHMRSPGQPYHPKGRGNGYVITFGDKRVYVAGDTENIPEMKALQAIDAAFLPMNLPYTMDSAMAVEAARSFKPGIVYPYHTGFGPDQEAGFIDLMKGVEGVEVRGSR